MDDDDRTQGPTSDLESFKTIAEVCNEILEQLRPLPLQQGSVTHIAGNCITLSSRYMRQRCEWCGKVLLEYDLERVAVPSHWIPGSLVRVDGNMSAQIEHVEDSDGVQLPLDACAFDARFRVR